MTRDQRMRNLVDTITFLQREIRVRETKIEAEREARDTLIVRLAQTRAALAVLEDNSRAA